MATLNRGRGGVGSFTGMRVSGYHSLLPDDTPSPDGSLPYSQASAVSVRLLSTSTMKPLRLPTFSPGPSFAGLDRDTLGCPKDGVGSPRFPGNPCVPMLCSQTPVEPRCLAFTALRYCPPLRRQRGPRRPDYFRGSITKPQHSLFTLRAVIADDYAKLASGGGQPFRVGV